MSLLRKVVFTRVVLFPLFGFVMGSLLETVFLLQPHSGVKFLPGEKVYELEYTGDVVLQSDNPGGLQYVLCSLDESASMFAPPR